MPKEVNQACALRISLVIRFIVVNGGFEEAFEDDGRSDKGGAARGKGSSVLLKLEMGLFVVGVDMGLEI
jgi:hypothetical protein